MIYLSIDGDKITLGGHKYTEGTVDTFGVYPSILSCFFYYMLQMSSNCQYLLFFASGLSLAICMVGRISQENHIFKLCVIQLMPDESIHMNTLHPCPLSN